VRNDDGTGLVFFLHFVDEVIDLTARQWVKPAVGSS
jgi:hypothetical protein